MRQRTRIVDTKPRLAQLLPDDIPEDQLMAMAEATFVDSQGARPARKAVQKWLEDQLLSSQATMSAAGVADA